MVLAQGIWPVRVSMLLMKKGDYSSDPTAQDNINSQEGVITTDFLGLNYPDLWLHKINVTRSYVFTERKNVGVVDRFRDFVTTDKSDKFYRENLIRTKTGIFLPSRGLEKMPMSEEILLKHS